MNRGFTSQHTSFLVRPPLPKDGWVDLAKPISTKGGPKRSTSYLGEASLCAEAGDLGPKEAFVFFFSRATSNHDRNLKTGFNISVSGRSSLLVT